jgi:hypothetical protein
MHHGRVAIAATRPFHVRRTAIADPEGQRHRSAA